MCSGLARAAGGEYGIRMALRKQQTQDQKHVNSSQGTLLRVWQTQLVQYPAAQTSDSKGLDSLGPVVLKARKWPALV